MAVASAKHLGAMLIPRASFPSPRLNEKQGITKMYEQGKYIYNLQDDIREAIIKIEKYNSKYASYNIGVAGYNAALRSFEEAKAARDRRLGKNQDANLNWFEELPDAQVLLFAICPDLDPFIDLVIASSGRMQRLPGVKTSDIEQRKGRLLAVLKAKLIPGDA
ncbi:MULTISPECIES: hypothetical protein [Methylobacterium]|uniref:hypothetical protein n=1 Tax=Methylobacterium TaxID=407 RepID=UPI0013ECFCCA|nr:hypothetical protein [Methylobacterium sp. DB0501]NGM36224.1 hypothetical protein [Methylobacterium sp. DB0501]